MKRVLLALPLLACAHAPQAPGRDDLELHRSAIVVDTHSDVTQAIAYEGYEFASRHGFLHEDLPLRPLKGRLQHRDRKIHLADPKVMAEIGRLEQEGVDLEHPYRLIGLREVRSHNSWMHNSAKLMPDSRRLLLRIHPANAASLGLAEGDEARVISTAHSYARSVLPPMPRMICSVNSTQTCSSWSSSGCRSSRSTAPRRASS